MPAASLTPVCEKCGYDLRGNPTCADCPECGWPVPRLPAWFIRDDHVWIRPKGACLPNLCIVTGEVVEGAPRRRETEYYPWKVFVPLLGNVAFCGCCVMGDQGSIIAGSLCASFLCIFAFAVAYVRLRTTYDIQYHLSPTTLEHERTHRKMGLALGIEIAMFAGFLSWPWLLKWFDDSQIIWVSVCIGFIVGPIVNGAYMECFTPKPRADDFDGDHLRLAGLSPAFIAAAAKLPGAVVVVEKGGGGNAGLW